MTQKHEVTEAYILYDTDDDCTNSNINLDTVAGNKVTPLTYFDPGVKKYDYDTDRDGLDSDDLDKLTNLHKFLCTNYGVATNVASADSSYYSYLAMIDPVPCKEALLSMTWAYIESLPSVPSSAMPAEMWLPGETFMECSADWLATVEAYAMTYLSSQLFEENPVFDANADPENQALFFLMFYGAFGLFWIHGSYPNYILGDVNGDIATGGVYYSPALSYDSDTSGVSDDPLWEVADAIADNVIDVHNSDGTVKSGEEIVQAVKDQFGLEF